MWETPNKLPETLTWEPTIPQMSDALAKLFSGKDLESKEMIAYIKEVYELIDSIIQKAPSGVKEQLLSWPSAYESISYFIEKLKDIYWLKNINQCINMSSQMPRAYHRRHSAIGSNPTGTF